MKNATKYQSKQHQFYHLVTNVILSALVCKKINVAPIVSKIQSEVSAVTDELSILQKSHEGILKNKGDFYSQLLNLKKNEGVELANLKESIVTEAARTEKEKRNQEVIDSLADRLQVLEPFFKNQHEELTLKDSQLNEQQISIEKNIELTERKLRGLEDNLRNHNDIQYVLLNYLRVMNPHAARWGACELACVFDTKVQLEPSNQSWRFVNLIKLVPDWHVQNLIYIAILQELFRRDDYGNVQDRNYHQGIAAQLFDDVLDGSDIWVRTPHNEEGTEKQYSGMMNRLDKWLTTPLPLEDLFTDPLVLAYADIEKKGVPKKVSYGGRWKGGASFTNQIIEFISFAKQQELHNRNAIY